MERLFRDLEHRRRELGMTCAVLAQRSGVSHPTVVRILSGEDAASFKNVLRVARALGADLSLKSGSVEDVREEQAKKRAAQIVGWVQGTSGLEGQALPDSALDELKRKTVHELLAGSKRKLWSE